MLVMYPPSLPHDVRTRAWVAGNGELGIVPEDASAFLKACRDDDVRVLGWELWIVDHVWDFEANAMVPAQGSWCGGVPVMDREVLVVIHGEGDAEEVERQLSDLNLAAQVQPGAVPHVRVNFTIG